MTREEAYQRLELPDGAGIEVVQKQFDALCEGWRVQINTASTSGMRQVFEEQLNQLKEAYSLLTGSHGIYENVVPEKNLPARSLSGMGKPSRKPKIRTLLIIGLYVTITGILTTRWLINYYRYQTYVTDNLNVILDEAAFSAEWRDEASFNDRMNYFWDDITPEKLNEEHRTEYMGVLYRGLSNPYFDLSEELVPRVLKFIQYDIEADPKKMFLLGWFYSRGRGIEQSYTKTKQWWEKAAEKGNAQAMFALGSLYENGNGVMRDYTKAKDWWEKAAENGFVCAVYKISALYANGFGVTQDSVKAKYWWGKGNAREMNQLGCLYANGFGVMQDDARAKYWWEQAAQRGNGEALYYLGLLCAEGYYRGISPGKDYSVTKDYLKAKYWWEKSAETGNSNAMYALGWLYEVGEGMAKDSVKAKYWYKKADY